MEFFFFFFSLISINQVYFAPTSRVMDDWDHDDVRMLLLGSRKVSGGFVDIPELKTILNSKLKEITEKCLSIDPEDRPSCDQLLEQFYKLSGVSDEEKSEQELQDLCTRMELSVLDEISSKVNL